MSKEKITEEQKEKALKMASSLGENATEEQLKKVDKKIGKFEGNKVLSSVWENILLLKALIKNPFVKGSLLSFAVGALLYLVLPIDVIPDILPVIGLLDDLAVILAIFPVVINGIKKDPGKALKVFDSLPSEVKKTASVVLGIAGGAYAGAKLGAVVGDKIKDIELSEEYEKLVGGKLTLDEGFNRIKEELLHKTEELAVSKVKGEIAKVFSKKYRRSLEIVTLFLLAILFSLAPFSYGVYISSFLLIIAYSSFLYSFIKGCIRTYPYIKSIFKEKSFYNGIEKEVKKQYTQIINAEKVLKMFGVEPKEEDIKKIVFFFLKAVKKQVAILILGFAAIGLGFWCFRAILLTIYLDKTSLELLFYPFFAVF